MNMSETFDPTTAQDTLALSTELVVRSPSAFEISTADNVYMAQEIQSRIHHIKTQLKADTYLQTQQTLSQDITPLLAECDAFLDPKDHRTWSQLADDIVQHLSALPAAEQTRLHTLVLADMLAHRALACQQHTALINTYKQAGITVTCLPDHPGSDAVFATDTGEQIEDCFLLGNLKNPRRHGEEHCTLSLLAQRNIPVKRIPNLTIEGGDLIYNARHHTLFVGEGFRNTDHPAQKIADEFPNITVLPIGLTKAEHYHLDCCFMVLSGGEILVYKEAITAPAYQAILHITQQHQCPAPYCLSQQEALNFGSNLVCVDKHVFHAAQSLSAKTLAQLSAWGYLCHSVQYDALHRSGGSLRCSTLAIRKPI